MTARDWQPICREQRLQSLLADCHVILSNMAAENRESLNPFRQRWPIHHEPLRADARALLPRIEEEIMPSKRKIHDAFQGQPAGPGAAPVAGSAGFAGRPESAQGFAGVPEALQGFAGRAAPVEAPQPDRGYERVVCHWCDETLGTKMTFSETRADAYKALVLEHMRHCPKRPTDPFPTDVIGFLRAAPVTHDLKECEFCDHTVETFDPRGFIWVCTDCWKGRGVAVVPAAPQDALQSLVEQWRAQTTWDYPGNVTREMCADELEAVLRASPAPEGEP